MQNFKSNYTSDTFCQKYVDKHLLVQASIPLLYEGYVYYAI